MAKKTEFKPDKPRSNILSKLYLTQTQRKTLLKWFLYSLALLVLSVLQDVVLCKMDIFGATTELVPCGIFLICLLEGKETGCLFALIAGSVYVFSGTAAGNYCIVFITAFGAFFSFLRQSFLQKGFSAALLCTFTANLVYELAVFGLGLFFSQTFPARIGVFMLTAVLSTLIVPVLYPLFCAIGKIGGDPWKE